MRGALAGVFRQFTVPRIGHVNFVPLHYGAHSTAGPTGHGSIRT